MFGPSFCANAGRAKQLGLPSNVRMSVVVATRVHHRFKSIAKHPELGFWTVTTNEGVTVLSGVPGRQRTAWRGRSSMTVPSSAKLSGGLPQCEHVLGESRLAIDTSISRATP